MNIGNDEMRMGTIAGIVIRFKQEGGRIFRKIFFILPRELQICPRIMFSAKEYNDFLTLFSLKEYLGELYDTNIPNDA